MHHKILCISCWSTEIVDSEAIIHSRLFITASSRTNSLRGSRNLVHNLRVSIYINVGSATYENHTLSQVIYSSTCVNFTYCSVQNSFYTACFFFILHLILLAAFPWILFALMFVSLNIWDLPYWN